MQNKIIYEKIDKFLVTSLPEFNGIYTEYLKDNNNEFLPYVLFEDFGRFIISNLQSKNINLLKKCFTLLNEFLVSGDEKVIELVHVTVLETLAFSNIFKDLTELYSVIIPPNVMEEIKKISYWRPINNA